MESEAFCDGWNAALDAIAASMEQARQQSNDSVAPAEHKGGVDAGLIWAIAEANRLKKETR